MHFCLLQAEKAANAAAAKAAAARPPSPGVERWEGSDDGSEGSADIALKEEVKTSVGKVSKTAHSFCAACYAKSTSQCTNLCAIAHARTIVCFVVVLATTANTVGVWIQCVSMGCDGK